VKKLASFASFAFLGCAHTMGGQPSPEVQFDTTAVDDILEWCQTSTGAPPEDWRASRAYTLTREWAKWSGMPDPDRDVEQVLSQIHVQKIADPTSIPLNRVERFLGALLEGREGFIHDATPHLAAYLPADTPIRGQVLFAMFIPPYAFAWGDGSIVINLTASYWGFEPKKVLHLLMHELFHNGYGLHQRGSSPMEAASGSALVESILWQTHNEGLATYIGYRARPPDLFIEDYALIEDAVTSAQLFEKLRQLIDEASAAPPDGLEPLKRKTLTLGSEERAFYVVGATMALRIETLLGRATLVDTIKKGPRAFFDLYQSTNPTTPSLLPR
jgi:hypothetical protein